MDIVESKAVEVVTGDWGSGDRNVLEDRARALLEEKVKRKAPNAFARMVAQLVLIYLLL